MVACAAQLWQTRIMQSSLVAVLLLAGGLGLAGSLATVHAAEPELPEVRREFRAAWVATVANIDWPSKPGLPVAEQQAEFLAILESCEELNLNAIVLQVRPAADALYQSELEPWSRYLTGEMGKAPEPFYDPLEFAVEESHKRGIELHAWFNPYRALDPADAPVSDNHISKTHPEFVRRYGRFLWLDPGEPAATEHTLAVIMDVVKRYDIDGVHMDDYFYPYPIRDDEGNVVPFPDDASWEKAVAQGTQLSRDDWRRENVNRLVQRIHEEVRATKPWVKFGISPFGIWRPGNPPQVQGFDQYASIYADARLWFASGWVDYFTPQLYWKLGPPQQSYTALLHWWSEQNEQDRHLWPGNYTSRLLNVRQTGWSSDEIVAQIWATRALEGASGNVHFSMKALQRNAEGVAGALAAGPYREPALIPASPWMQAPHGAPVKPQAAVHKSGGRWELTLSHADGAAPWLWVIRTRYGEHWNVEIVSGTVQRHPLPPHPGNDSQLESPAAVAVSAVNRIGQESDVVRAEAE
ncbi:glycoside hydrolase family 10 protein [Candidatus Laterigemmans baculatus]|nr:family 10 glycosylhydrolase [Candidatus Laterigemmans baculatus]